MIKTVFFSILLVFACSYGSFLFFKGGHPFLHDATYWQIYSGYERSNPYISYDDSGMDEFVYYTVVSYAQRDLDRIKPKVFAVTGFAMLLGILIVLGKYRKENKLKQSDNNGKAEIPEEYKDLRLQSERRSQRKKEVVSEGEIPIDYKNIKIKPNSKSRRKESKKKESEESVKYRFYAHMAPNRVEEEE